MLKEVHDKQVQRSMSIYIYVMYISSMNYIINFLKDVEKTKHVHDYNVHGPTPPHITPHHGW